MIVSKATLSKGASFGIKAKAKTRKSSKRKHSTNHQIRIQIEDDTQKSFSKFHCFTYLKYFSCFAVVLIFWQIVKRYFENFVALICKSGSKKEDKHQQTEVVEGHSVGKRLKSKAIELGLAEVIRSTISTHSFSKQLIFIPLELKLDSKDFDELRGYFVTSQSPKEEKALKDYRETHMQYCAIRVKKLSNPQNHRVVSQNMQDYYYINKKHCQRKLVESFLMSELEVSLREIKRGNRHKVPVHVFWPLNYFDPIQEEQFDRLREYLSTSPSLELTIL